MAEDILITVSQHNLIQMVEIKEGTWSKLGVEVKGKIIPLLLASIDRVYRNDQCKELGHIFDYNVLFCSRCHLAQDG